MANEQNLRPGEHKFTLEEHKRGGIASGAARAAKRDLRKALESLLEKDFTDESGNVLTGTEIITLKLFQKATKGDVKAFETLRDTIGQKPVEKVIVADINENAIDDVERILNECMENDKE